LQAFAGAGVGAALHEFVSQRAGVIVLTISGVIGLCALFSPLGLFAAMERLFAALGRWTSSVLSWVVLPFAFYGFFVPFRVLFRRGRRDSMKRYFDEQSSTYWSLRETPAVAKSPESRKRQYRP
jgi:hypothetical protein